VGPPLKTPDFEDEDDDVKAAFVAVYGMGQGSAAHGGGVLVWDDGSVITAAHVVNSALGRSPDAGFTKGETPPTVMVAFPGSDGGERQVASVAAWIHRKEPDGASPLRHGSQTWSGDLAVLKVTGTIPPTARPVPLDHHRLGSTVWSWYGSGEATTPVSALVESEAGPWIALNTVGSAKKFVPGYSGGPVWDRERRCVVGLVVSVDGDLGYAMPTREILKHLSGQQRLLADATLATESVAVVEQFRTALGGILRQQRMSHQIEIERIPKRLGLSGARAMEALDNVDVLIAAALKVHRGVATLARGFCDVADERTARHILTAASLRIRPGELLSAEEFGRLVRLLAGVPAGRFHTAARRALPDVQGLPGAERGYLAILAFLEHLALASGTAPSLVLALEFLAATVGEDDREALRSWADEVVERIGGSKAALLDRRAEAVTWAARRENRARVQVRLERYAGDLFRHRVWVHYAADCRTVCVDDTPKTSEGILACLEGVLRHEVADDVEAVLLEFFVEVDDLDLEVDRWAIPGVVDRMLGVEYEVVLRCLRPRLVNLPMWHKRWRGLGHDDAFVLDDGLTTPNAVYAALQNSETDVACVIAFPADSHRLSVIAGCVYAGVPAVLWLRRPHPPDDRKKLMGLTAKEGQCGLPTTVRRLRIKAAADAEHPGGHVALLWDDPERYPRELLLEAPRAET
jgi:hypothetical protein